MADVQMQVVLPEYTVAGSFSRIDDGNGNVYAQLAGISTKITSDPFVINRGVQQLALSLTGLTTVSDQYRVDVLSGVSYSTSTKLGSGTVSDNWQTFAYNVSAWQGQSVKLPTGPA